MIFNDPNNLIDLSVGSIAISGFIYFAIIRPNLKNDFVPREDCHSLHAQQEKFQTEIRADISDLRKTLLDAIINSR